ncbi:MAG: KEOPS complex N(6)-L-threonylcarbamoyladenine synthase Kae1 [Conexivisphaerales archaeon]
MHSKRLLFLGIESTAHTFGAAVVASDGRIMSDVRQVYRGTNGSGIHPAEASHHHAKYAPHVVKEALKKANVKMKDITAISYSAGPGLGPCLRVGAVVARSLSSYFSKPLIPVNHAVGHIELGCLLTGATDPVCLLVSGGHTALLSSSRGRWRFFGETLDITIGQLLDQFGRALKLSSPCGAEIEKLAGKGSKYIQLPYTVKGNDMSFSGLLTSAKKLIGSNNVEDIAYSLQETAFSMLCEVTERALAFTEKKELLVVGGVAANRRLSIMLEEVCKRQGAKLFVPPIEYSGDCGSQIGWAGAKHYSQGFSVKPEEGFVRQKWRVDEVQIPWRS